MAGSVGCFSRRERRAYLNRYVTDEQRSRRPIFIATNAMLFMAQRHQAQNQFLSFSSNRALARSRASRSLADKLARPYFAILSSNRSISLLSAGLKSVVGAERVLGFETTRKRGRLRARSGLGMLGNSNPDCRNRMYPNEAKQTRVSVKKFTQSPWLICIMAPMA